MSRNIEHNVVRILYILILSVVSLFLISPFLVPVIFAGTVALALFPLQLKLEQKGLVRKKAAVLLTAGFATLISIPFFFFVIKGILAVTEQLEKFSNYREHGGVRSIFMTIKSDIIMNIQNFSERFGMRPMLSEKVIDAQLAKVNTFLLGYFQDFLGNLPAVFLFFIVMVVCTYSFLKRASGVRIVFQRMFGLSTTKMDQLVAIFINDSRSVYVSNLATGGFQSLIVSTAVSLMGLGDFFLVFFVTIILSFIPVVGAAPVAFLFSVVAFFKDQNLLGIALVAVGAFTGVVDNFLRPYLASIGESKIPPVVAFVFVIGGAFLLGFPGLFIGLIVGAFAYDSLPLFWEEMGRSETQVPLPTISIEKDHGEAPKTH